MYITQNIANRIKLRLKEKHVSSKTMLSDLDMGINSISEFAKGKQMSCISLARIADYLDCSVDYLLGRTDTPLTENEQLLLDIIRELDDDKKQLLFETAKAMANKNWDCCKIDKHILNLFLNGIELYHLNVL